MLSALIGFASGAISGLGLGGGTVLMPLMTAFVGLSQLEAQCANLIAYLPSASVALRAHIRARRVDGALVRKLLIWGFLGMAAGIAVAFFLPNAWLKKGFAVFLIGVGLWQFREGERAHRREKRQDSGPDGCGEGGNARDR